MNIRDHITAEVATLRQKASTLIADAQAEATKVESKAAALEQSLASIPAEVEALAEDAAARAWAWIKSVA